MSLTVLLLWQHNRFQTSPILKAFLATFVVSFWSVLMVPHMHNPTSIWICLLELAASFSTWKSATYWNQVSFHGNRIFYCCRCVSCRTTSLPNFNDLHCKLAEIGLSVWHHQSSHLHIFTHSSSLNIFGTDADICKQ